MEKTKLQILKEKKDKKRTFKEDTSMGIIQDRLTALEIQMEELKK